MRLFLIASLLFSGGTAVAMQNETVNEEVTNAYNHARVFVQKRLKKQLFEQVKEDGFPYPPQEFLDTLTDEQEAIIMTTIDQINVEYDWVNMTDEEVIDALKIVKEEMDILYEELGIEGPSLRQYGAEMFVERIQENGLPYPPDAYLEGLTEEQATAITDKIDELNATYDWVNMTSDEIKEALQVVKDDMVALYDELGIDPPKLRHHIREHAREVSVEYVKENGFPYPSEKMLENLTEEQVATITEKIDEINATYDWENMTDEEILEALQVVRTELDELREDLGIEAPQFRERIRNRIREHFQRRRHHNQETNPNNNNSDDSDTL